MICFRKISITKQVKFLKQTEEIPLLWNLNLIYGNSDLQLFFFEDSNVNIAI